MSAEIVLLLLRLFGALCLLSFLGVMVWLSMRDLRAVAAAMQHQDETAGALVVVADESEQLSTGRRFPLLPVTSIGRAPSNVIVLDDGYISTEHALIMRRNGRWWVEDLHSRNGTRLNELPLQDSAVLTTGDVVTVGGISLRLELVGEPLAGREPVHETESPPA